MPASSQMQLPHEDAFAGRLPGSTAASPLPAVPLTSAEKAAPRTGTAFSLTMKSGLGLNRRMGAGQRALDFAGAQAAGADIHPLDSPIDHDANALHIGRPSRVGLAVRMADQVAVHRTLAADLAMASH